ncbi:helix-turn-helix domain-containing protein [Pseudomonas sp. WOUb67]|uniref:helix-turn-helix domain-containing protein n=1 Tax=Pseudomonas sp. WOUb67 TaxID=3161136 RepID=UPI003CEDD337
MRCTCGSPACRRWAAKRLQNWDYAETGQSPARAVESLRLEAARLMIEQSLHSLDVVARETGFRDRRHMREVFIRGFGVPPQAVRRDARRVVSS